MLGTPSYGFDISIATKITEIQNKTESREWWWVALNNNPADMTTKTKVSSELEIDSVRQNGPFLYEPDNNWLIRCHRFT